MFLNKMVRNLILLFTLTILSVGVTDAQKVSVIPTPLSIEESTGVFRLEAKMSFYSNTDTKTKKILKDLLGTSFGVEKWKNSHLKKKSDVVFLIVKELEPPLFKHEAYELEVSENQMLVKATTPEGLFYAAQTLSQIAYERANSFSRTMPTFKLKDEPRFEYRGLMLDVSRHFFSKDFVKKQIDALAFLKLNRLHLHLTDAAGWRLEIEKYPELTNIAAWRTDANWKKWWNGDRKYAKFSDSGAYGGYYTKEDIKEILAYAEKNFITIIPEIEMPGHSEEVLAAYPELSCSGLPYKNADFCAGNEKTFEFLENVLSEVIELFPSEYIHIGGDEAGKAGWKTCEKCQARMKEEGLSNVDELQSYFIKRISKFLHSKGRKLVGWDEILEGGLADDATVMSWRGVEGGLKAVKSGHPAIMTPGEFCYFDAYQDAPYSQPEAIGGYLPLQKVYNYNPIPEDFTKEEAELIQGVQANLWTEYIPTAAHAEMMIYPRLFALAEVAWSEVERKEFKPFHTKSLKLVELFKQKGYQPFELSQEIGNRKEAETVTEHLGRGKKVTYNAPYNKSYVAAGDATLTDGLRGGWTYGDKRWQGFISANRLDVVIDLEKEEDIHEIYADIMQSPGAEVYLPSQVIVEVSLDGKNYTTLLDQSFDVEKGSSILIKKYGWKGQAKGRYVRFVARSSKTLGGWIFTDEIVIK